MNLLGRRAEANPQWSKLDRRMVAVAVWLAPLELAFMVSGGSAFASVSAALVRIVPLGLVALAIWSGLPRSESDVPVSLALMRGVLGTYFILHAIGLLLLAVVTLFVAFAAWTCGGRH